MSRSYGGKLGVWLTGRKRKSLHRDPVSKKRSFRKSMMGVHGHGSFLPAKFKKQFQSSMANEAEGNVSGVQDIVGWDDVRCRPIYYKSNGSISTGANDCNENDGDGELTKLDSDNLFSQGDEQHSFPELNGNDREEEEEEERRDEMYRDENIPWNEGQPSSKGVTVVVKGCKKQAYGNQKRRGRLLSSMATSVLEQCASPIQKWESYNYANIREPRNRKRSSNQSTKSTEDDSSTLSFSSMKTTSTLSARDNYNYTPPRPGASTVCLDSKTSQQECDSNVEKDELVDGEGNESEVQVPVGPSGASVSAALQVPQDMGDQKNDSVRNGVDDAPKVNPKLRPRIRKINIREKRQDKESITSRNRSNGNTKKIRQPTCSTSLLEARAFFEHLDATHVLKIE